VKNTRGLSPCVFPLVFSKSKTGFTKKYAEFIREALGCPAYDYKSSKNINLDSYDVVIYGGSLYASGILGLKKFKTRLKNQKLIVFAVGATPPKEGLDEELIKANFDEEERKNVKFFYMRGGFNFDELNLIDKGLMKMMKRSIEKKDPEERTPDEKGMLNAFNQPFDFTRSKNIEPLLDYLRKVENNEENVG
jgi:menaquinone-dependent protoporphyrinogen IX oxidase